MCGIGAGTVLAAASSAPRAARAARSRSARPARGAAGTAGRAASTGHHPAGAAGTAPTGPDRSTRPRCSATTAGRSAARTVRRSARSLRSFAASTTTAGRRGLSSGSGAGRRPARTAPISTSPTHAAAHTSEVETAALDPERERQHDDRHRETFPSRRAQNHRKPPRPMSVVPCRKLCSGPGPSSSRRVEGALRSRCAYAAQPKRDARRQPQVILALA